MQDDNLVDLPSAELDPAPTLAYWEDDGSAQWPLYLPICVSVAGFVSQVVDGQVSGPHPQTRQLVLTLPTLNYDLTQGATLGVARGIQWWEPGNPVLVKLVNRTPFAIDLKPQDPVAHVIAVSHDDQPRLQALFADHVPSLKTQQHTSNPTPPTENLQRPRCQTHCQTLT